MRDALKASFRSRSLLLGLTLSGLVAAAGFTQAAEPAEKVLPANTFFLVKIENMASLRDGFTASQMGQLLADPGMKPFLDKLTSVLEQPNEQLKQAVGLTIPELLTLPQGQVFVSLVGQPGEKIPLALFVSADAGDNAAKMAEVMATVDKLAEQNGATVATDQADSLTLHVIRSKDADESTPPLVWAQSGSVFHIATSAEVLKDVVAHAGGRENSLATTEIYAAVARKLGGDAQLCWFLDVQQILQIGTQFASQNGVDADTVNAQIQQLGFNGLKGMGGRYDLNQGEFDSVYKMYIYAPSPVHGVLKLFSMPIQDLRPEPWVPASVASYQSVSWDIDAAWNAITELADSYAPGVLDQVQQSLATDNGSGLKFKDDLITPLAKRISTISDFKKPVTDTSQRAVVAIALDDPKAAQNTINKIFDLTKATPKQRTFQGTTIYDFEIPAEMAQGGITGPIALAIAKDHLFISFEPTLLEQILRGGYPALAESADYQTVSKHFPSQASFTSFDRPDDGARAFYGMLGNEQFRAALDQMRTAPNAPSLGEVLDPKLLPEFSVIEKYLSPRGGFGVQAEDGAVFTQFTIKKGH